MKLTFYTVLWASGKPIETSKTKIEAPDDRPFTFGRDLEHVDCCVPIATASRVHASLICEDGQWVLHDGLHGNRSQNGIYYGPTKKDAIAISALVSSEKLTSPIFIARSNGDRFELVVEWVDRDVDRDTASFDLSQQFEQKLVILSEEIVKIREFEKTFEKTALHLRDDIQSEIEVLKKQRSETQLAIKELKRNDKSMSMVMIGLGLVFLMNVGDKVFSDKGKAQLEEILINGVAAIVAGSIGSKALFSKPE